jgi:predicted PurR-regulated permease PerM
MERPNWCFHFCGRQLGGRLPLAARPMQQINALITAPKIIGDSVGLHPLTVIFSMLFWSLVLGGLVGALLAVPCTAAVKVLFRRFVWERKLLDSSEFVSG